MALTVPVVKKFDATARITAVSSGKSLAYGQADGVLKIDSNEFKISNVTGLYELTYGDLIVGTGEGIQIFRDGEEIRTLRQCALLSRKDIGPCL